MQQLPDKIPDHVREAMTIIMGNLALEADKVAITLQQFIHQARATGMDLAEIERMLLRDLREGGQLFGEFRKNFKSQMRYSLEEVARGEVYEEHKDVEFWEWFAVSDKRLCDDCAKRNKQIKTMDEWRRIGLPGAGRTICQRACRCMLGPADSLQMPDNGIIGKKT